MDGQVEVCSLVLQPGVPFCEVLRSKLQVHEVDLFQYFSGCPNSAPNEQVQLDVLGVHGRVGHVRTEFGS